MVVGSVDLSGSDASLVLIAAEELSLPAEAVNMTHDNTDSMPYSGLSAGSKTTYTVGSAVLAAARDARSQLFERDWLSKIVVNPAFRGAIASANANATL